MNRHSVEGGWYADSLTTGEYASLVTGKRLETHAGELALPPGDEPLWVAITRVGGFKVAGQGHYSPNTWLWDGAWSKRPQACGTSPVIFDRGGAIHISDCGPGVGAQGWTYVAPDGHLVTGDAAYGPKNGLTQYTDLSDAQDGSLMVGQGHQVGGVCVWDGTWKDATGKAVGALRRLAGGECYAVRARRVGVDVSVCWYDVVKGATTSQFVWATVAELLALPRITFVPPIDIPPIVIPPKEPTVPVPDRSAFVRDFLGPRLRLVGDMDATRANTFAAVNACVIELRKTDTKWGLLEKTGGDRVRDRAADIALYSLDDGTAQVVDIVGNGEGAPDGNGVRTPPVPGWSVKDIRPIAQWKQPYPDADVPPVVVPPDVPPTSPLEPRVAALEITVKLLLDTIGEHDATIADLTARLKALEDRPIALPENLVATGTTEYAGSSIFRHSHKFTATVKRG